MVNPFDLKSALLAKHAQHVVLIHFPIALFISAVAFDLIAHLTKRRDVADAAYYNLLVAAISTFPVLATGVLAWQFQLEGQKLKGILLLHLVFACVSTAMIWLALWVHFRARWRAEVLPRYRLAVEFLSVGIVALTGQAFGRLPKRRKRTRLDTPMNPNFGASKPRTNLQLKEKFRDVGNPRNSPRHLNLTGNKNDW